MDNNISLANTTCVKLNDHILISFDDAMILCDRSEPIRALSLNHLDSFDGYRDRDQTGYYIYKYPSFPRLDRDISLSGRTISTTHLDSLSPRISTVTISQDLDREKLELPLNCTNSLTRSISARTVDLLPTLTLSASHMRISDAHLVPHMRSFKETQKKICRSSSCPTMDYIHRAAKMALICSTKSRDKASSRLSSSRLTDADLNLEGEVVTDLPVEPKDRQFPDFIPEIIEERISVTNNVDQRSVPELSTYGLNSPRSSPSQVPFGQVRDGTARTVPDNVSGFRNLDLSSSYPRRLLNDHRSYKHTPQLVQIKCLQWLNSLDKLDSDI